ncbi:YigZ family protein [Variovorax dokdonensis]|uniref:YigZ family protein n=1 Tax=Variovorax dokdonensis TaxID=344883 RepID=A0ABT7N9D6_9BURK|nr:YigZ family protein [Variovorax dokdonensis]MDM0044561.1 YigZ family protein [Variovorax dokdonensis]
MAFSLSAPVHSDLLIKKSRFIGCVQPVDDRAAALSVVAALRAEHPAAAHVCWALMAGGQSAANDDGEPGGKAGRPMLEVLRHRELDGVLATVVRYFGGVKLGAGGLVRAYTEAVSTALTDAMLIERVRRTFLACAVPYAAEGAVRRELAAFGATMSEVRHETLVHLRFEVDLGRESALVGRLQDITQGRAVWVDDENGAPRSASKGN